MSFNFIELVNICGIVNNDVVVYVNMVSNCNIVCNNNVVVKNIIMGNMRVGYK